MGSQYRMRRMLLPPPPSMMWRGNLAIIEGELGAAGSARCGFLLTRDGGNVDYINFLLVIVPFGILAGELGWDPTTVFVLNFFAIIPLAAVLSFATEEISMRLGETLGGLLNATFGNAVELIVSFRTFLSLTP